jgi:4,5-DOPA dioxygenase extradiol
MHDSLGGVFSKLNTGTHTERMPLIFIGHGSPLNAINNSSFSEAWKSLSTHIPIPRAVVCMSAHWLTDGTQVGGMMTPPLIYDFYGFPPPLYSVTYPAPGDRELAGEITTLTTPSILVDTERGLDHGVWTVLMHLFPNADVPIVPLSIDYGNNRRSQYELLQNLRPLRDKGVLFIGSGNIIHNLMRIREGTPYDWAESFDAQTAQYIAEGNHDALIGIESLGEIATLSVPTDDHYRPMINTLALAYGDEAPAFFNTDIDLGSIGMRSFVLS